jgi:isocitrate dehydrogenase (NAD+)
MTKHGTVVPDEVINSISKNRVALKGPITTPIGYGFASANVTLRKRLNLYANVRPAKTLPGVKTRFDNVDLVVVRENSEDLYSGLEHVVVPGVVESLKIITETASLRIGRRIRFRPQMEPQESNGRPQSQYHEAGRRPFPGMPSARRP